MLIINKGDKQRQRVIAKQTLNQTPIIYIYIIYIINIHTIIRQNKQNTKKINIQNIYKYINIIGVDLKQG